MTFLEKLDFLMKENKLNRHSFAIDSGISYTTIDSLYKKGYSNIKLSTIMSIADYFHVSIDYLVREDKADVEYIAKPHNEIDDLDEEGKSFVKLVIKREKNRMDRIEELEYHSEPVKMAAHSEGASIEKINQNKDLMEQEINKRK